MVKLSTPADALYRLEELLLVAGKLLGEVISSRTVRLYATQGLIDRPDVTPFIGPGLMRVGGCGHAAAPC